MKVLVAHRDAEARSAIAAALRRIDAEVLEAPDVKSALVACREHEPSVVLVELAACGKKGPARVLGAIKGDADLFRMSVVLVQDEPVDLEATLSAQARGAEDVLRWPACEPEIVSRVMAAERASALRDQLFQRERGLEELAFSDELTRLYNRRFMSRQLSALVRSAT